MSSDDKQKIEQVAKAAQWKEIDDTVLKVAAAGYFHDIGKFAQAADMPINQEQFNKNAIEYHPLSSKSHFDTHKHAGYTAAFLEDTEISQSLPKEFRDSKWGEGEIFVNLAAGHHKPKDDSAMQWIITEADRLSAGNERAGNEGDPNVQKVHPVNAIYTRLIPLLERLGRPEHKCEYVLPLNALSSEKELEKISGKLFPMKQEKGSKDEAKEEYKKLFNGFCWELKDLPHYKENLLLWFEHFDSLYLRYVSCIPAQRASSKEDFIPDVSLYDHSKTTSALATALYLFHKTNNSLSVEEVKKREGNKFLLIAGDFWGIQEFIFSSKGDSRKYRAKLLRGRSFSVSLYCELAADLICRKIGLPFTSIIFNAAGKFTILAPNIDSAKEAVKEAKIEINDWLHKRTYGETALGITSLEATSEDLEHGKYRDTLDKLAKGCQETKARRLDLSRYGVVAQSFLEEVSANDGKICQLCGKRPSNKNIKDEISLCQLCDDHRKLGEHCVKLDTLAVGDSSIEAFNEDLVLSELVFDRYKILFTKRGTLNENAKNRSLLRFFRFSLPDVDDSVQSESPPASILFLGNYVPKYDEYDLEDPRLRKEKQDEESETIEVGRIISLNHLAALALNLSKQDSTDTSLYGLKALGVLKADVDNLGKLLRDGLPRELQTMSRLATLSRQLHYFFAVYLPYLLELEPNYRNIYIVFAGGDDLFLIGPWNKILALSLKLREEFQRYVAYNPKVHFSAGISVHKAHSPINKFAESSEEALKDAKAAKDLDKSGELSYISVYDEVFNWDEVSELAKVSEELEDCLEGKKIISTGFLYRLNYFLELAGEEEKLKGKKEVSLGSLQALKWRALLKYSGVRNIARDMKESIRAQYIDEWNPKFAKWLEDYKVKFKLGLWPVLYNKRRARDGSE